MNKTDFINHSTDFVLDQVMPTLGTAAKEYAQDEDAFSAFNTIATLLQSHPRLHDIPLLELREIVGWCFLMKHQLSMIKDVSIREDTEGREMDFIAYGLLQHAMRKERRDMSEMSYTISPGLSNIIKPYPKTYTIDNTCNCNTLY